MELYAQLVREKSGSEKIELFCECVELLNLRDSNLKIFAAMCKFMESDYVEIK